MEKIKNFIQCKNLTWFGKILFGLGYLVCVLLVSFSYILIYAIYIPYAVLRWAIFGEWRLCNLWGITDWDIDDIIEIKSSFYASGDDSSTFPVDDD